ncbi:hypothetical protein [Sphingomonas koreensis]|uniref:hypothetical protein n=2 Tax=Sphingomonas koreensis TaxID=93064 RepID=UPI000F7E9EC8|nr:hypothetical protein [Sphingomonas koreensis]
MIASGNGRTAILEDGGVTVHRKGMKGEYTETKFFPYSSIVSVSKFPAGRVIPGHLKIVLQEGAEKIDYLVQQADVFDPFYDELLKRVG